MAHIAGSKFLIVDDEPSLREMLSDCLAEHDGVSSMAANGMEALRHVSVGHFDLVLLDITMPGMSGIETLRKIQEHVPGQPVVMLTAVAEVKTAVEAMQLGALDYLLKPVTVDVLLSKIASALDRGSALREKREKAGKIEETVQEQERRLEQRTKELQALNKMFQEFLGDAPEK